VLQHDTGTLIDSTQPTPAVISGTIVRAGVVSGGGSAFYGVFFENGGKGWYDIKPVNAKALAFFPAGGPVPLSSSVVQNVTRGFGGTPNVRAAAISKFSSLGGVVVKAVHHPPIPHLPYMEPSLDENEDGIRARLQAALIRSAQGA
jgi:hypothetical protein